MSNSLPQQYASQLSPDNSALDELKAIRQELEATRKRLLKLREEVDSIIGDNMQDWSPQTLVVT